MKFTLLIFFALAYLLSGEETYEHLLEKNGFVILDEDYKQGFEPYIDPQEPVFITSDSLLMAFHRLFEQQVFELELATLAMDRTLAPALWLNLPQKPLPDFAESEKGWRAARLFSATAYRLLFQNLPEDLTKEEAELVEAEVLRVETATGEGPPEWLDSKELPEEFVLPYSSFKPVGSWSENQLFRNYYRYRKWLQEIPLVTKDPIHVAVIAHLRYSLESAKSERFFLTNELIVRPSEIFTTNPTASIYGHSWDMTDEGSSEGDPFKESADEFKNITPNDFVSSNLPSVFYFLSSDKFESQGLFKELILKEQTNQLGLCVASAFGNSFAKESVFEDLKEPSKFLAPYGKYAGTLYTLASNTDTRLPALFKSESWARKQANTVCGSWTEWTYARQLSAKETAISAGMANTEIGYLEPFPDFYREFAALAQEFASLHTKTRGSNLIEVKRALLLKGMVDGLRESQDSSGFWIGCSGEPNRCREFNQIRKTLFAKTGGKTVGSPSSESADENELDWAWDEDERLKFADKLSDIYEGWLRNDADAVSKIRFFALTPDENYSSRFYQLAILSLELRDTAERQLDKKPLTSHDSNLLHFYGMRIARIMFYEKNSYLSPRDDAPRIVRYATGVDPIVGALSHHAAIARPRKIIVRYPKPDGTHVDCVGSVYAFRQHASEQTPTNEEWTKTCRSSPWPDWMKTIVHEK